MEEDEELLTVLSMLENEVEASLFNPDQIPETVVSILDQTEEVVPFTFDHACDTDSLIFPNYPRCFL